TVLFEVLSASTENYDRGIKFKLYRSIPSLRNYVLISSTEYAAEIYTRVENDDWKLNTSKGKEDHIHISAIDYDLLLQDVYSQIDVFLPK
ncbi:MAG TPA: Uma2 family endonuclease, partial [Hanamia sp.]